MKKLMLILILASLAWVEVDESLIFLKKLPNGQYVYITPKKVK
jgi:hypothetical protein